jgi:hypothetical protein
VRTTHVGRLVHRCRGWEIDSCHGKPTTGGTPLERKYTKNGRIWEGQFWGSWVLDGRRQSASSGGKKGWPRTMRGHPSGSFCCV